jgi:hypothetical protein
MKTVLIKLCGAVIFILGFIYITVLPDFFPSMDEWWVLNYLIGIGICIGGADLVMSSKDADEDTDIRN